MPAMLLMAFFSGLGGGELLLVFAVALLLFGAERLPKIAQTIGRMLDELRRASDEFKDEILNAENSVADSVRRELSESTQDLTDNSAESNREAGGHEVADHKESADNTGAVDVETAPVEKREKDSSNDLAG